jgi:putative endonuclease
VNRKALGRIGEGVAARFLLERGYRIIGQNVRFRHGEIDLVAWDGNTLVFVEVKTRLSARVGTGEEAITHAKQRQLTRLAAIYLAADPSPTPPCRFDVVVVEAGEGEWTCRLLPNAFLPIPER